jgi:hypothetical protein
LGGAEVGNPLPFVKVFTGFCVSDHTYHITKNSIPSEKSTADAAASRHSLKNNTPFMWVVTRFVAPYIVRTHLENMNNPEIFLPNTFVAQFVGRDRSRKHENSKTSIHRREGGRTEPPKHRNTAFTPSSLTGDSWR